MDSETTKSDERAGVLRWLTQRGYPLELRVGRTLRDLGWHVNQALWYEDFASSKLRELDVFASRWVSDDNDKRSIVIELAIECKSSKDKPWIAFTAPREKLPRFLRPAAVADQFSRNTLFVATARSLAIPGILDPRGRLAHGLVKAHSEGKTGDPTGPFAAIQSVVGATQSIGDDRARLSLMSPDHATPHIIIPTVVVDGSIYAYSVDTEGAETLAAVQRMRVPAPSTSSYDAPVVWVVRYEEFDLFLQQVEAECVPFVHALLPHASDIIVMAQDRARRRAAAKVASPAL